MHDLEFCFVPVGKKINEIGRFQGHFSEGRQKWLYYNCCISWPLVSYTINFFNYENPRKSRRGPSCPEPAYEGKIQMEYACNQLCSQSSGAVTNNYCCIFFVYCMWCFFQNLSYCNICVCVCVCARVCARVFFWLCGVCSVCACLCACVCAHMCGDRKERTVSK